VSKTDKGPQNEDPICIDVVSSVQKQRFCLTTRDMSVKSIPASSTGVEQQFRLAMSKQSACLNQAKLSKIFCDPIVFFSKTSFIFAFQKINICSF
jgi:hypothetical protein